MKTLLKFSTIALVLVGCAYDKTSVLDIGKGTTEGSGEESTRLKWTRTQFGVGWNYDINKTTFNWQWNADNSGTLTANNVTEGQETTDAFKAGVAAVGGAITSATNAFAPGVNAALKNRSTPNVRFGPLEIPAGEAASVLRELREEGATVTELPPREE